MRIKVALYIHIPFCLRRCTYCDFNTYTGLLDLRAAYVAALQQEMLLWATRYPDLQAQTLYFGGGTPSLLAAEQIASLIAHARQHFALPEDAEISLEANPGTIDTPALHVLWDAGINRLSLGVQSSYERELALLGRIHSWPEAVVAIEAAQGVGFENLSLDLMYGLPHQTLEEWQKTLDRVLVLLPRHLSLYALTLEAGTPLWQAIVAGTYPAPEQDMVADMYELASDCLQRAGFWQYEISNWAQGVSAPVEVWALPPGGRSEGIGAWVCHHNLSYWRNTPWLGVGAGAHSWLDQQRWANLAHPHHYIAALEAGRLALSEVESINLKLECGETMMMGLRLAEGVDDKRFQARFGRSLMALYGEIVDRLVGFGLVSWDGERVRLSARGRLLGNQVFGAFLPE